MNIGGRMDGWIDGTGFRKPGLVLFEIGSSDNESELSKLDWNQDTPCSRAFGFVRMCALEEGSFENGWKMLIAWTSM